MAGWRRFRRFSGPDPVGDVDDEISFHFEMRVRELLARGESPERARELARIRFGEYEAFRDECVTINERRRRFLPQETAPGAGLVVVLDHGFWQRELGGDADVLGRTLVIAGQPYTVVGVLASGAQLSRGGGPSARFEAKIDMYQPLEQDDRFSAVTATGRRGEFLRVLARARPDTDAARVGSDMRRIGSELQSAFPDTNNRLTFDATSLHELIVGDVRTPLLVLLGAVGFVLLIACANVANLLLARSSARRGELAVRAALGAGHGRLLRHLLTEAVVLGLLGSAVGLLVAYWGTGALVRAQPADIPRLDEIGVDATVALFTLGAALISAMAFGAVPALQATGGRLMGALRESGRGSIGGGQRLRATLVVAETALAVVLLTGAGLLVRSFVELTRVDTGFQPERAIALRLTLQGEAYQDAEPIRIRVNEVLARAAALPGVTAAGATTVLPYGGLLDVLAFTVDGAPPPPSDINPDIGVASVTPHTRRDRHAASQRARLHGPGPRRRPAGRDHQRGRRAPLVRGRRPDRPPRDGRRKQPRDRRRRGRRAPDGSR